jgi:arginine utilization protein RocB
MQRHTTSHSENKKEQKLVNGDQEVGRQKPAHHQEYCILLRYFGGLCSMSHLFVADLIAM